ncbi:HET-domain-containing protein [Mollisia scopiformis]|uniref:HET-domain-containing protein n=1 Tax=Mollisia scopiformis TaxID=149040 RepID=A0A194WX41_MOLSC|nr:HET-domain-containing protein [Mollisia scopiformis]KUJ12551.1 HET-domain-containing protein [Mollisia scopiformis]
MRLINTVTGAFEEFIGDNIPPYAILSHTWEGREVSFKDTSDPSCKHQKAYHKIEKTCQLAAQRDIKYAWVDTCCIDKSSSAELTEAINSMYRWYQRSNVCFVYLSDLCATAVLKTALRDCRWFTRGWTLQELIAPSNVYFFDQDWNERGSKQELVGELSNITGIKIDILRLALPLSSIAIAQRMSWAANRTTTRMQDMAYCLLGIFDVNMPLLYGEEEKAFRRLQEEIIRSNSDLSIFAWTYPRVSKKVQTLDSPVYSGILAKSPSVFLDCVGLEKRLGHDWREVSSLNGGIKTQVQILSEPIPGKRGTRYLFPLDYSREPGQLLAVRLRKCGPDKFIRDDPWTLVEYAEDLWANARKDRCLLFELPQVSRSPQTPYSSMSSLISQTRAHVLQIQLPPEIEIHDTWPWDRCFDAQDQLFFGSGDVRWDSGAMRLMTEFIFESVRRETKVQFECMLYAVGWSSPEIGDLQCTIMLYDAHAAALKDLQSRIAAWDHTRPQVVAQLVYYNIPKTSAAVFKIPKSTASVVISFTPKYFNRRSGLSRQQRW